PVAPPVRSMPRVWPPVVLLALFWAVYAVWRWTEMGISLGFMGFLMLLGVAALTMLLFVTWWLAASRVSGAERLLVTGVGIVGGVAAAVLGHRLLGPFLLLPGLPLVLTMWTLGLIIARKWPPRRRGLAVTSALLLSWGAFLLLRAEGMAGD